MILSTGGVPLIYIGDEVCTTNDYAFAEHAHHADDSRWVHRPVVDAARYAERYNPDSDAGRIFNGLRRMISVRQATPALGGTQLVVFDAHNPHVLAYMRNDAVLVLCNFSEQMQRIDATTLSAMPMVMNDLITGLPIDIWDGLELAPYQVLWLWFGVQ